MTFKKVKISKHDQEINKLESKFENACYTAYNNLDEVISVIVLLKQNIDSDTFNKYHAKEVLNAILTLTINAQHTLMDDAGVEY